MFELKDFNLTENDINAETIYKDSHRHVLYDAFDIMKKIKIKNDYKEASKDENYDRCFEIFEHAFYMALDNYIKSNVETTKPVEMINFIAECFAIIHDIEIASDGSIDRFIEIGSEGANYADPFEDEMDCWTCGWGGGGVYGGIEEDAADYFGHILKEIENGN